MNDKDFIEAICDDCGNQMSQLSVTCTKCNSRFLIDADPIFDPNTGEIYRKMRWISKEEAEKLWPKRLITSECDGKDGL